jgi:hypothetical protein
MRAATRRFPKVPEPFDGEKGRKRKQPDADRVVEKMLERRRSAAGLVEILGVAQVFGFTEEM